MSGRRADGTNPRVMGTNPRANETNPRANETNPRANGSNPRAMSVNPSVGSVADLRRVSRQRALAELVLLSYDLPWCAACEGTGWLDTGDYVVRCEHQPMPIALAELICRRWARFAAADAANPFTRIRVGQALGQFRK